MNDALADRPVRKFNPGTFQSDDEVVRQFVVRQKELDLVLEVIRGNTDSPSCQHVLIVGPRGRGKTMLLARVGAELRTDNALAERLFPVRFMEESQEIATPRRLLARSAVPPRPRERGRQSGVLPGAPRNSHRSDRSVA